MITCKGKDSEKIDPDVYITELLCCTPETIVYQLCFSCKRKFWLVIYFSVEISISIKEVQFLDVKDA